VRSLFNWLKALPLVSFALLLGAGFVATAFAVWFTWIIAYGGWPAEASIERIKWLGMALLTALGLVGLVMVTLAFGRIEKLSISGGMASASIDFEDGAPSAARFEAVGEPERPPQA
jgi:hypothetical protein